VESFGAAPDFNSNTLRVREDQMATAEGSVDCFVIEVSGANGPLSVWIEKSHHHVLSMGRQTGRLEMNSVFKTVKLNESLPEELFIFKPPPDARRTD
jgi:hypothetical protein